MRYCLYVFFGDEIIDIIPTNDLKWAVELQSFWNDPIMQDNWGIFVILRVERRNTNATV